MFKQLSQRQEAGSLTNKGLQEATVSISYKTVFQATAPHPQEAVRSRLQTGLCPEGEQPSCRCIGLPLGGSSRLCLLWCSTLLLERLPIGGL